MTSPHLAVELPESVTLATGEGGLDLLRVATTRATAEVYLHGAHVSAWTPAGEQPVLWVSSHSTFAPGQAIRGGIPVCFPWFGAGRSPGLAPAHGFARLVTWRLVAAHDDDGEVTLVLRLTSADVVDLAAAAAWPHDFEATVTVRIGGELGVSLQVRNTGEQEISYEEALHTYLSVADVRTTRVLGLDGARYLDKAATDGPTVVTQDGDLTFSAETDRVYSSAGTAVVDDGSSGRRIGAAKEGSAHTVVWNPWVAKAAAMPDFGDDEWPGMVCLEAANALDEAIVLAPGQSHTLAVTYTVSHG